MMSLSGCGVMEPSMRLAFGSRMLAPSALLPLRAPIKPRRRFIRGKFEIIPKEWLWSEEKRPLFEDPESGWNQKCVRTGLLTKKLGMMTVYDEWLRPIPVTVLHVPFTQVVDHKTEEKHGYNALVLGSELQKPSRVNKPQRMDMELKGFPTFKKLTEFRISPNAFVPIGTRMRAVHFLPGQMVDVRSKTKGKGFQGAMKKWGFGGGRASHGNSVSHRALGSTGQCQDPGKVFKGKKMHGRMGGYYRTVKNQMLFQIDTQQDLLFVAGGIGGGTNGWVWIKDAKNKRFKEVPPFPTYTKEVEQLEDITELREHDPDMPGIPIRPRVPKRMLVARTKPPIPDLAGLDIEDSEVERLAKIEENLAREKERLAKEAEERAKRKAAEKEKRMARRKISREKEELLSMQVDEALLEHYRSSESKTDKNSDSKDDDGKKKKKK